jgi:excisionase family DNA binding protein
MKQKFSKGGYWRFSRRDLRRCGPDGRRLYLTIEEAAAHFGVNKSVVLEWVKQDAVPYHELGGRVYLNRREVEAYWAIFQAHRR